MSLMFLNYYSIIFINDLDFLIVLVNVDIALKMK